MALVSGGELDTGAWDEADLARTIVKGRLRMKRTFVAGSIEWSDTMASGVAR